ncbi:hypothetical protein MKZ38_000063 [Zalerion maritima]|uniref:Uncharacterized protein n=1 Tax=Zalerion maritima TaxID=339359 RepID=A0AAD5RG19_9PEZI|nr:hypothetical protein MKZ38_000063 [Zalerion maritima]
MLMFEHSNNKPLPPLPINYSYHSNGSAVQLSSEERVEMTTSNNDLQNGSPRMMTGPNRSDDTILDVRSPPGLDEPIPLRFRFPHPRDRHKLAKQAAAESKKDRNPFLRALPSPPSWCKVQGSKPAFLLFCSLYTAVMSLHLIMHALRTLAYEDGVRYKYVIGLYVGAIALVGLGLYPVTLLAVIAMVTGGLWIVATRAGVVLEIYLHVEKFWPKKDFRGVLKSMWEDGTGDNIGDEAGKRINEIEFQRGWFAYGVVFFSLLTLLAFLAELCGLSMWIGSMLDETDGKKQKQPQQSSQTEGNGDPNQLFNVDLSG